MRETVTAKRSDEGVVLDSVTVIEVEETSFRGIAVDKTIKQAMKRAKSEVFIVVIICDNMVCK